MQTNYSRTTEARTQFETASCPSLFKDSELFSLIFSNAHKNSYLVFLNVALNHDYIKFKNLFSNLVFVSFTKFLFKAFTPSLFKTIYYFIVERQQKINLWPIIKNSFPVYYSRLPCSIEACFLSLTRDPLQISLINRNLSF